MIGSENYGLKCKAIALNRWLVDVALPLWWENGVDRDGWGYQESLKADGTPSAEHRRCRVQPRQSYAFAVGVELGWPGDPVLAVQIAQGALRSRFLRPDGLYRTLVSPEGAILDDTPKLYDHAFILLALAAAQPFRPSSESEAKSLVSLVTQRTRHSKGGFVEADCKFLSNPHMHLFEAALAWAIVGQDLAWWNLASEIAELALMRLFDPDMGFVREYYDSDWSRSQANKAGGSSLAINSKWAWLMQRWALMSGDLRAATAAQRLHIAGKNGISIDGKVVIDEMRDDYSPLRLTARLWPQTEWLKSAALLASIATEQEARKALLAETSAALDALMLYLDAPQSGLWLDRRREDGTFSHGFVPASSLYHIVTASNS